MDGQKLGFVNELGNDVNYRRDQTKLLKAAKKVTNNNFLDTLKYITTSFAHENVDVEFALKIMLEPKADLILKIELPIIECNPKDELGFYVSWGDGIITHNEKKHIYKPVKESTKFIIRIFGLGIRGFGSLFGSWWPDNDVISLFYTSLTEVISFGHLGHTFTSLKHAFNDCVNLTSVPSVIPSTIKDVSYMFYGCHKFNDCIGKWDTKNITDMSYMFYNCKTFNQSLNSWKTCSVTAMNHMFFSCNEFNKPIGKWDVSNVTNMESMMANCWDFNQPLSSWNTRSVSNMRYMFYNCWDFNQPIGSWNVKNVRIMSYMFAMCWSFNQSLLSWETPNLEYKKHMLQLCTKYKQPPSKYDEPKDNVSKYEN